MAQFNTGNTWSSGDTVTAAKLNQMITDATIRVEAITDQSEASGASNSDMVLIESGGSLYKVAAEYIGALGGNSASTDEVLVGDGSGGTSSYSAFTLDSSASPSDGDVLTYDSSSGYWTSSAGSSNSASYDEVLVGDGSGGVSSGGSYWIIDTSVSPSDGDSLTWDDTNSYWTASSGDSGNSASYDEVLVGDGSGGVSSGGSYWVIDSSISPSDGDTLSWDDSNSYWTVSSGGGSSSDNIGMEVFTSSGTFTVPSGVTAVKVTVIAGGGAGGGGTSGSQGGWGGAGGGAIKVVTGLTESDTVSVTVGSGGSVTTSDWSGSGGSSSFGSHCSASGGSGGNRRGRSQVAGSAGSGSSGDINSSGEHGNRNWEGNPSSYNPTTYNCSPFGYSNRDGDGYGRGGAQMNAGTSGIVIVEY